MAADETIKPRWAPRVPPRLIQRLYDTEARGILDDDLLDDDLLDDVGIRLYLRCQSILGVRAIQQEGVAPCPQCGATIVLGSRVMEHNSIVRCAICAWELPWSVYWRTFRHQELAYDTFVSDYIDDWTAARTLREKMLAIDRVIHRWHNDAGRRGGHYGLGRPSGVNLIEGNRRQVVAFLDALTAGRALPSAHAQSWRAGLQRVRGDNPSV